MTTADTYTERLVAGLPPDGAALLVWHALTRGFAPFEAVCHHGSLGLTGGSAYDAIYTFEQRDACRIVELVGIWRPARLALHQSHGFKAELAAFLDADDPSCGNADFQVIAPHPTPPGAVALVGLCHELDCARGHQQPVITGYLTEGSV